LDEHPSPDNSSQRKDPGKDKDRTISKKNERGLLKGLGGFLDKKESSDEKMAPSIEEVRYLVCNTCRGYYQLQKGEEPEDFSDECECGGHLECKDSKE
jgi:hypothetical protein